MSVAGKFVKITLISAAPIFADYSQQCGGYSPCLPAPKGAAVQTGTEDTNGRTPSEVHTGQRRFGGRMEEGKHPHLTLENNVENKLLSTLKARSH